VKKITKADWIALRLLSLLLKTDVSNVSIRDVYKTLNYYCNRFGDETLFAILNGLIRETGDDIDNPQSMLMRSFRKTFVEDAKIDRVYETYKDMTNDTRLPNFSGDDK
jgi:hypothetical protein